MYILWLAGSLLDLLSQTPDMYVNGTHISRIFISPYQIQQILPAVNLVGVLNQKFQDVKLFCCQVDFLIIYKDSALSQSRRRSPTVMEPERSACLSSFLVRRIIALMRAFTSKILNGLVI